jgi:hypothetical protein
MLKNIRWSICMMLVSTSLFAQNSFDLSKKEALKAQSRKIIFVVKDVGSSKNKELATAFNEKLKSVVKNNWKFSASYDFKTLDEIKAIQKNKGSKEYAVLFFKDFGSDDLELTSSFTNPATSTRSGNGERSVLFFSFMEDFKPVYTSEHFRGSSSLTMITLPHNKITATDINSALSLAQAMLFFELNDAKKPQLENLRAANLQRLKDKTLLVPKELVEGSASFKGNYPYNFQMVSPKELADYISKGDSNYVYLELFPFLVQVDETRSSNNLASKSTTETRTSSDAGNFLYYVFNTATGETLVNSRQDIAPNYGSGGMTGPAFALLKHAILKSKFDNQTIKGLTKDKL